LSGNVAGRILPGGGATATAFTVSMLRRADIDTGEATAAFGTSTLLQISTALALPILALPANSRRRAGEPRPRHSHGSRHRGCWH